MSIEDASLGKLTKDHLRAHQQVSEYGAELEQIGEDLILLGNNLKKRPQDIRIGEAKITLKIDRNQDRIVLLSQLNILEILRKVVELNQASEQKERLAGQITETGMGYIVDGLENRTPPTPKADASLQEESN